MRLDLLVQKLSASFETSNKRWRWNTTKKKAILPRHCSRTRNIIPDSVTHYHPNSKKPWRYLRNVFNTDLSFRRHLRFFSTFSTTDHCDSKELLKLYVIFVFMVAIL